MSQHTMNDTIKASLVALATIAGAAALTTTSAQAQAAGLGGESPGPGTGGGSPTGECGGCGDSPDGDTDGGDGNQQYCKVDITGQFWAIGRQTGKQISLNNATITDVDSGQSRAVVIRGQRSNDQDYRKDVHGATPSQRLDNCVTPVNVSQETPAPIGTPSQPANPGTTTITTPVIKYPNAISGLSSCWEDGQAFRNDVSGISGMHPDFLNQNGMTNPRVPEDIKATNCDEAVVHNGPLMCSVEMGDVNAVESIFNNNACPADQEAAPAPAPVVKAPAQPKANGACHAVFALSAGLTEFGETLNQVWIKEDGTEHVSTYNSPDDVIGVQCGDKISYTTEDFDQDMNRITAKDTNGEYIYFTTKKPVSTVEDGCCNQSCTTPAGPRP